MRAIFIAIVLLFSALFLYALNRFRLEGRYLSLIYGFAWLGWPVMAAREMRLLPRVIADQFIALAFAVGLVSCLAVHIHEMSQPNPYGRRRGP